MNIIVYSKEEGFEDGVRILSEEALRNNKICKMVETSDITNFISSGYFEDKQTCVYFLCSDYSIPLLVSIFKDLKQLIVNESFLSQDISISKFEAIEKICHIGISTPRHISSMSNKYKSTKGLSLPIYVKSKSPRGLVTCANDLLSLNNILKSLSERRNYYLKENVKHENNMEIKVYYVRGATYMQSIPGVDVIIPDWFRSVLDRVSEYTKLDVFSADFFVDFENEEYYCFDINHASSFYKSEEARSAFINRILK